MFSIESWYHLKMRRTTACSIPQLKKIKTMFVIKRRYRQGAHAHFVFVFFLSLQYEKMKMLAIKILLFHIYVFFYADSENPTFNPGWCFPRCRKSKFSMFFKDLTMTSRDFNNELSTIRKPIKNYVYHTRKVIPENYRSYFFRPKKFKNTQKQMILVFSVATPCSIFKEKKEWNIFFAKK